MVSVGDMIKIGIAFSCRNRSKVGHVTDQRCADGHKHLQLCVAKAGSC